MFTRLHACFFTDEPMSAGMDPFRQIVDTRLAGCGTFRIMLAHNLRRIAANIADILKANAISG